MRTKDWAVAAILLNTAFAATSQADDVARVQTYLMELGYDPGVIDGRYGARTGAALAEFYSSREGEEFDGDLSRNELEDLAEALGVTLPGIVGQFTTVERAIPETTFKPDERVAALFEGYERFVHGEFDFPSLRLSERDFTTGTLVGDSKTDSGGYYFRTMVQLGDYGDVDGDGDNDLVLGGWRANGENDPARLHFLYFEKGLPAATDYLPIEGTAAPWVRDFDGDGQDEVLAVGFLDFPVNPASTYYIDGDLSQAEQIGPPIDSHESNVADFDGDGDLDIVAISYGDVRQQISVYINNGVGFDHRYLNLGASVSGSAVEYADFDADGIPEFIVGDSSYPRGDAGLWRLVLHADDDPFSRRIRASNVVARQYFSAPEFAGLRSHWDINHPSGRRQWLEGMRSHDVVVEAVDIDLDGDLDLLNSTGVWSETTPMGVLQILVNDGEGNFTDETADRLFNYQSGNAHTLHIVDVNGDTYPDIIMSDRELWIGEFGQAGLAHDLSKVTSGNKLLINDGTGHFVEAHQSIFSEFTVLNGWANSWFPVINPDGTITFVSLFRTNDGQRDLWQFAKLLEPLSTGPYFEDPSKHGVPEFNEFFVLRTSQAAREAVLSGTYESALAWFKGSGVELEINARSGPVTCEDFGCIQSYERGQEGGAVEDEGAADEPQLSHTDQLRIRLGLPLEELEQEEEAAEPTLSHVEKLRLRLQQQRN